nr:hypothetical protein [uncultured Niameybacter sp.]
MRHLTSAFNRPGSISERAHPRELSRQVVEYFGCSIGLLSGCE